MLTLFCMYQKPIFFVLLGKGHQYLMHRYFFNFLKLIYYFFTCVKHWTWCLMKNLYLVKHKIIINKIYSYYTCWKTHYKEYDPINWFVSIILFVGPTRVSRVKFLRKIKEGCKGGLGKDLHLKDLWMKVSSFEGI